MMGWYGGWGGLGWIWMAVMMLAFWGALITAVVALVRSTGRSRPEQPVASPGQALALLDESLARGALSEDEYLRRRALLEQR